MIPFSPLIIVHIGIIIIAAMLRPFGVKIQNAPSSPNNKLLAISVFFVCLIFILAVSMFIVGKAWAMGTSQRQYIQEMVVNSLTTTITYEVPRELVPIPAHASVTYTFDDGWETQYTAIFPLLKKYKVKGTFYIITQKMLNETTSSWINTIHTWVQPEIVNGEYMDVNQVKEIANAGNEIAAHTRHHPLLTTLSISQATTEVQGSKNDLNSIGIDATNFAYPEDDFNYSVEQLVKNAGFMSGRTTEIGLNSSSTDPYRLLSYTVDEKTTLIDVENLVEDAINNDSALILTFHKMDNTGTQYSVTPELFDKILKHVESTHIPVKTMDELVNSFKK